MTKQLRGNGVHTHLITSYYAAPLMIERRRGLIVEVTDGNHLAYNDVGVYYFRDGGFVHPGDE